MREEKVSIPSKGIELEGLLGAHEGASAKGGVILCHPHPQYGGDMHNVVISTAKEAAYQEGFSTLRFNFRGVGGSGGSYSEGIDEREDVKGAVNFLFSALGNSGLPLILLGYSFGAWAAVSTLVEDDRVRGIIAIAPPLQLYDFGLLEKTDKVRFFVAGDQDPFCPIAVLRRWYERLRGPKSLVVIEGADHFFFIHHRRLAEPLRRFLKDF